MLSTINSVAEGQEKSETILNAGSLLSSIRRKLLLPLSGRYSSLSVIAEALLESSRALVAANVRLSQRVAFREEYSYQAEIIIEIGSRRKDDSKVP